MKGRTLRALRYTTAKNGTMIDAASSSTSRRRDMSFRNPLLLVAIVAGLAAACGDSADSGSNVDDGALRMCIDDGNPCTSDVRVQNRCTHPALADGTACPQGTCQSGTCVSSTSTGDAGTGGTDAGTGGVDAGTGIDAGTGGADAGTGSTDAGSGGVDADPSSTGAKWYVDNAVATSGNGTSWASAFKNFSDITWSAISPGDSLYISGGTTSQTYTSPLTIGNSGTASSRITVRVGQDAGHNGTVVLDGAQIYASYQNYITIDGSVGTSSRLKIQNVTDSSKDNGWAIQAGGVVGLTVRYVTIASSNNGINLTYGDTFEIDHNSITVKGDVGIRGFANPDHGWDWNLIHDNSLTALVMNDWGGPDTIQPGGSTSIYNNKFYAVVDSSAMQGQHPDNLQLGGMYTKVYGNTFTNCGDSNIDFDAAGWGTIHDVYIYNNLFHLTQHIDDYPDFIRMYSTGMAINAFANVKILNNTFVDDSGWQQGQILGFGFANGSGAGSGNEIKNNLARGTGSMGVNQDTGGGSWTVSWGHNIYPVSMALDPSATVGVPSLDANFIPTATDTLARDHGVTLSYFSTDKLGTARPQGSAWDIGAFEYRP